VRRQFTFNNKIKGGRALIAASVCMLGIMGLTGCTKDEGANDSSTGESGIETMTPEDEEQNNADIQEILEVIDDSDTSEGSEANTADASINENNDSSDTDMTEFNDPEDGTVNVEDVDEEAVQNADPENNEGEDDALVDFDQERPDNLESMPIVYSDEEIESGAVIPESEMQDGESDTGASE